MPLAIVLILSFSMNKACQEILRAIALKYRAPKNLPNISSFFPIELPTSGIFFAARKFLSLLSIDVSLEF